MRFKSHKKSTFWSHSWHGGQLKKILTLLTYNGYAALLGGFLVAILMMILFGFDLLPGLDRQPHCSTLQAENLEKLLPHGKGLSLACQTHRPRSRRR